MIRFAYPSKTATYLGAGLPVLVAVEPDSSLALLVEESGIGGHLTVDDPDATARTLVSWLGRRTELATMSRQAASVWKEQFDSERLLPRWTRLLEDVAQAKNAQEISR